jgi:hypothetical protein
VPPVEIGALAVSAVWHERFHADAAARFFREIVVTELARLLRTPPIA